MWDEAFDNVDAHLTYPNGDQSTDETLAMPFTEVYDDHTITVYPEYADGFLPEYSQGL